MGKVLVNGVSVKPADYSEAERLFNQLNARAQREETVAGSLYELYLKAQDKEHCICFKDRPALVACLEIGEIKSRFQAIFKGCLVIEAPGGGLISRSIEEMRGLNIPKDGRVVWSEAKVKR
jgi:hypothetical protein